MNNETAKNMSSEYKKIVVMTLPTRQYYIVFDGDVYHPSFQPVNPKTGKPWQASRHIEGGDVHVVFDRNEIENFHYKTVRRVVSNVPPTVTAPNEGVATKGYSTFEGAMKALKDHGNKSGFQLL